MYLTLAAWATLDLSEPGEDSLKEGPFPQQSVYVQTAATHHGCRKR